LSTLFIVVDADANAEFVVAKFAVAVAKFAVTEFVVVAEFVDGENRFCPDLISKIIRRDCFASALSKIE